MSEKEVLSQEEIDALLNSVDEKEEAHAQDSPAPLDAGEADAEEEGGLKTLSFTSQERIVRGGFPVLEKIHDRAIKLFGNDIYQLLGKDLTFEQDALQIIKHKELTSTLPTPTLANIFKFRPLRGKIAILYDAEFVFSLVDNFFGGSSQFGLQQGRTDFTATELSVLSTVTEKLIRNIEAAWTPILKIEITKIGEESNPQLVHFSEPNELILITRFSTAFGKSRGSFMIAIPYSLVEPLKQRLDFGASRSDEEVDPQWLNSLREEVMDVELKLNASMQETETTVGKVLEWQVDDFIPLTMKEVVIVEIEGKPSYWGTLGRANDKRAIRITKKLNY